MKTYNLSPADWRYIAIVFLSLFMLFQIGALAGQSVSRLYSEHQTIDHLKSRISLDLQFLDVGNQALHTPPNKATLKQYMTKVNTTLLAAETGIVLSAIQAIPADNIAIELDNAKVAALSLENSEQAVEITLASMPLYHYLKFSPLAFFASLCLLPLLIRRKKVKSAPIAAFDIDETRDTAATVSPRLIIDLKNKTISNNKSGVSVLLQNKPLCFYIALIRYCIDHPDTPLLHHKDIPQSLTQHANKAFSRLLELGHSKRKRPDFNANLDKTLSEIRAALDEVFVGYSEDKAKYYPPRAQGEGSRSKQHSYALPTLNLNEVEILGD